MTYGEPLRPIRAAARKIRMSRDDPPRLTFERWQARAWDVYDRLGEVFFMTRYRKGIASRLDYYVARKENVTDDPIPVESGPAVAAFNALGGANMLGNVVADLMPHWDVPGEGYVVGFDEEPRWRVLSTEELKKKTSTFMAWLNEDGEEVGEVNSDEVYRVWSPHPRFAKSADSPTRHILEVAEELILLGREVRARSMSRLNAGVWMIPDGLDLSDYEGEEGEALDLFAADLVRKMARPITDPGDPAALVPIIVEMARDDIEAAAQGWLSFARDYETSAEDRKELLTRLATGLDLPAEIFLGLADVNHWGQWLITEHAVSRHAAPTIDEILESLTVNWFRPQLNIPNPDEFVLWRDLAPATIPTDRSELTLKAHDRFLVSDKAARSQLDFNDDDAPSPEEIEDRLRRASAKRGGTTTNPAIPDTDKPGTIAAAANMVFEATQLAEVDRGLLAWTLTEATSAVDRAMTAAAEDDTIFDAFEARLRDRISRAQAATRNYLARLGADPGSYPPEDTDRGIGIIVAALVAALARSQVEGPVVGETVGPVPADAVREGLSVAGGGLPEYTPGSTAELVGNGRRATQALVLRGYRTLNFRWVYGDPAAREANFEPHMGLDGLTFTDWEDEALTVTGTFPARSHYRPGDHRGCLCSFVRELTLVPALVPA